jgi:hypothetical protein
VALSACSSPSGSDCGGIFGAGCASSSGSGSSSGSSGTNTSSGSGSSGSSGSGTDLSAWTDATWSGTYTDTITCGSTPSTYPDNPYSVLFTVSGGELSIEIEPGCVFYFTVSGSTATLSNGPVVCSFDTDAGIFDITTTAYTLTMSGSNLSGILQDSITSCGTTCTVSETISASKL